jgi:flagellar basal body-associated protein FliL
MNKENLYSNMDDEEVKSGGFNMTTVLVILFILIIAVIAYIWFNKGTEEEVKEEVPIDPADVTSEDDDPFQITETSSSESEVHLEIPEVEIADVAEEEGDYDITV